MNKRLLRRVMSHYHFLPRQPVFMKKMPLYDFLVDIMIWEARHVMAGWHDDMMTLTKLYDDTISIYS